MRSSYTVIVVTTAQKQSQMLPLTLLMLDLVSSFSYTPRAGFRSFPYTFMLVLVGSFSYTPDASFSQEYLLRSASWF